LNKKVRFLTASLFLSLFFFLLLLVPYSWRYQALLLLSFLTAMVYWWSLRLLFSNGWFLKMMVVLLPLSLIIGLSLFLAMLSLSLFFKLLFAVFIAFLFYVIFLVENIFLVAIGYKTVPLYRSAYTVSLILVLLTAFFLFDSLFSFRFMYYWNAFGVLLISLVLFSYQFWAIRIELSDDGSDKSMAYVWVPALIMAELAMVFSFWPVGIFKGSVYLVSFIYIISGLMQAEIRDRLFKKTWKSLLWVLGSLVMAMLVATKWG